MAQCPECGDEFVCTSPGLAAMNVHMRVEHGYTHEDAYNEVDTARANAFEDND